VLVDHLDHQHVLAHLEALVAGGAGAEPQRLGGRVDAARLEAPGLADAAPDHRGERPRAVEAPARPDAQAPGELLAGEDAGDRRVADQPLRLVGVERLDRGDAVEVALVALGDLAAQLLVAGGVGPELDQHRDPAGVGAGAGGHLARERPHRRVHRPGALDRLGVGARPAGGVGVKDRQEQPVLAGEVRVDRALGVAGLLTDLLQRGAVEPARQEDLPRRGHQLGPGPLLAVRPAQPIAHSDTPGIRYRR
jgi:hypothetical protein